MKYLCCLLLSSILFHPLISAAEYHPPPEIVPIVTESPVEGHYYSISCYFWGNDGTLHCFTPAEKDAANTDNCWTRDEGADCLKCSKSELTLTTVNGEKICIEDCAHGFVFGTYNGTQGCMKCPDKYNFENGVCQWDSRYGPAPGPPWPLLEVFPEGKGSGIVKSDDGGIVCGGNCQKTYPPGTEVTLVATPAPDSYLNNFVYDDNGVNTCSGNTCRIKMTSDQQVVFIFEKKPTALYTGRGGSGNGRVSSTNGPGIDCGSDCWQEYPRGSFVNLRATPAPGSWFDGWEGTDCTYSTDPDCGVLINEMHGVYAFFTQPRLYVNNQEWSQTGSGTVFAQGINCGTDCVGKYDFYPIFIDLTAVPDTGSTFAGWYGDCSGTNPICRVMWDKRDKHVGAVFNKDNDTQMPDWLWVRTDTTSASGRVTGWFPDTDPPVEAGIDCHTVKGGTCRVPFVPLTRVTLRAEADPGWEFVGWSDSQNCPGIGDCTVTVFGIRMIWPRFRRIPRIPPSPPGIITGPSNPNATEFALQTLRFGTGSGLIESSPGNATCGDSCYNLYQNGTEVLLSATPETGSIFVGWLGGGCSGTDDCRVTMTTDLSVAAIFNRFNLTPLISLLLLNDPKVAPGLTCGLGRVYDCALNCLSGDEALDYIGDGYCDDGSRGYDLRCGAFNDDDGDCDDIEIIDIILK